MSGGVRVSHLLALAACALLVASAPSRAAGDGGVYDRVVDLLCGVATTLGLSHCPHRPPQKEAEKKASRAHLVELTAVEIGALNATSVFTGSLRHRQTVRVFTQEEGRIIRIVPFEGDRVGRGELVVELDAALLGASLDKAEALTRQAAANLKRVERLRGQQMVSEDEYLRAVTDLEVARAEVVTLRTRLGYTRIEAPFDAVVSERLAEPGDVVERHAHVLTLVDPASLVIEPSVSEMLLPFVGVGDGVSVRIDALGDRAYAGRVLRIHPELDPRTRQGRVEVALDPVPGGARAGQFARVGFITEALDRKVIPFAAVRRDRDGEHVYRVDAENVARRVPVRTGRRLAARVEVLEGLEAGDRVVVKGFLGLNDGKTVKPVDGEG